MGARLRRAALALLLGAAAACAGARGAGQDAPLLLEVRLRQHTLDDTIAAWPTDAAGGPALPLGELARLLTLAIRSDPAAGAASGYLLSEDHPFSLDANAGVVQVDGRSERFDPALLRRDGDDIYVPLAMLARWLPLDLRVDFSALALEVTPRARLPLEAALARRAQRPAARAPRADPGYPRQVLPYGLLSAPTVDQSLAVNSQRGPGGASTDIGYSAYASADLAGTQAALFTSWRQRRSTAEAPGGRAATERALRLTVGRHDPSGHLLGPLQARSVLAGSVAVAGVPHISLTSPVGNGVLLANAPLGQADSFDRHSLQGALAEGWDVELFHNGVLIGVQAAPLDGRYSFSDLPLAFGANDFRLVFHGPLGQLRVEKHSFLLEDNAMAPGQLHYLLAAHRPANGAFAAGGAGATPPTRALARIDAGLLPGLAASASVVRLAGSGGGTGPATALHDSAPRASDYAALSLHAYLPGAGHAFIASATAIGANGGGRLGEVSLKTAVAGLSVAASRAVLDDFYSDIYRPARDPVRVRDEVRIEGAAEPLTAALGAVLPLSLQLRRDTLASKSANTEAQARLAWNSYGAAFTNLLRWQSVAGVRGADGSLTMSQRGAGFGLGAQLQYGLAPRRAFTAVSLAADMLLRAGMLASVGVMRELAGAPGRTQLNATLAGPLGDSGGGSGVAIAVSAFAGSAVHGAFGTSGRRAHELGIGVRLFTALAREPRTGAWRASAQPLAGGGAASVRVFLDLNGNGVFDAGDTPIAGAALEVNGARHMARTGADGIVVLERLATSAGADIAIDSASLADPRWVAARPGLHVQPRAGRVALLELPVAVSGDIDGVVWLPAGDGPGAGAARRPAAGKLVRLLDPLGATFASATSGADGYYLLPTVLPGAWRLQVDDAAAGQHATLAVTMGGDGDSLAGRDLQLLRRSP